MPYYPHSNHHARWSASSAQHHVHDDARSRQGIHPHRQRYADSEHPPSSSRPETHTPHSQWRPARSDEQQRASNDIRPPERPTDRPVHVHRRSSPADETPITQACALADSQSSSSSCSRKLVEQQPWTLGGALDAYILPTPSDTLLLNGARHRRLCASTELMQMLCSLEDPEWPERDFRERVSGVVTVSWQGRWFALVACKDEKSAQGMKITIEDKVDDLITEFVEREALVAPHGTDSWTLCGDVMRPIKKAGALVDACDTAKWNQSRLQAAAEGRYLQSGSTSSRQTVDQVSRVDAMSELPGSIDKDHRKLAHIPSSKKLAAHIGRWNALQQLPGDNKPDEGGVDNSTTSSTTPAPREFNLDGDFDYTDADKQACLLCQRQFKSTQVLQRHTVESDLHKRNLQDASTCEAGQKRKADVVATSRPGKMKRAGFTPISGSAIVRTIDGTAEAEAAAAAYRDRALERRRVFGKETLGAISGGKPVTWDRSGGSTTETHESHQNRQAAKPSISPPAAAAPLDESSVGGALLAKMGWQSGQGLGSSGEGRVAPVEAYVYAPGSGIGSNRSGGGGQGRAAPPPTVEEYAAKRARLMHGDAATLRAERMRDRFKDG